MTTASAELDFACGAHSERADVLAFLRKRQANAVKVGSRNPEENERAKIIADQIGIEIEMIEQGLHVGDAVVEAQLEAGPADWPV